MSGESLLPGSQSASLSSHCVVTGQKGQGSSLRSLFFFFLIFFIYLFLAALGLRCCVQAFSSCSEWGLLFVAVHRLLIAVDSLVAEHGL